MRRLLVAVLFFLGLSCPLYSSAAISLVGVTPNSSGGSFVDSITINRSVTGGSLLVTCASLFNSGSGITISDDVNGTHTQAFSKTRIGDSNQEIHCYYFANAGSGSTTVTVNPGGASSLINAFVAEFSGVVTTSPLDTTATDEAAISASSTYTASITTGTLAQAENVVVGIYRHSCTTHTTAPGSTYTELAESETSSFSPYNGEYKLVSSTSAVTVDWAEATNSGGACAWIAGAAVFKAAAGTTAAPLVNSPIIRGLINGGLVR